MLKMDNKYFHYSVLRLRKAKQGGIKQIGWKKNSLGKKLRIYQHSQLK